MDECQLKLIEIVFQGEFVWDGGVGGVTSCMNIHANCALPIRNQSGLCYTRRLQILPATS